MKKTAVSLAVLLLMLAACTAGVRYTPAEISTYPADIQEKIRNSEVAIGMTRAQVRYAWGAPSEVRILEGNKEEWIYKEPFSRIKLTFTNGEVSEVITKMPGKPKEAKPKEAPQKR